MKLMSPERFAGLLIERENERQMLEQRVREKVHDSSGRYTSLLARHYRFRAIASYIAHKDVSEFRTSLLQSVTLFLALLKRYDEEEPIAESYVSVTRFSSIFDALAASNGPLALIMSRAVGGRGALEGRIDYAFAKAFGYTLKALIEGRNDDAPLLQLTRHVSQRANRNFSGYLTAFQAISDRNAERFQAGVLEILNGHRREIAADAFYGEYPDLCIWGLGLVNFAAGLGLNIEINDPFLPTDLIKPTELPAD